MSALITRTKVILPHCRKDLLSRQRLLDMLYELLDYKLILVIAPAGYGKTSLLVDFAHQADLPVCWYSLDSLDRDLIRFIAHLIASLNLRFPDFGKASLKALEATNPLSLNIDQLVATLVNDAYENIKEHFLLVLDDFHLILGQNEIQTFVNRFIQDIAENCHLILASRTLLSLPDLALMVARSQVGGIGFEELAFQSSEIKSLALQNYQKMISDHVADELVEETEGWITGLLLTTQIKWLGATNQGRAARVSNVGLYDYLAQQLLDRQPEPVREFLLRTAYLNEFNSSLCEAVFGSGLDWAEMIETIQRENLFVLPVGEGGKWLRYHHLFQDFLQAVFEREQPQNLPAWLHTIARVYSDRQEWENAYQIYQRLEDIPAIADLIEQAGSTFIKNMRLASLLSWIDALPDEIVSSRPGLLSIKGGALLNLGQAENSLVLLNQAEASLRLSGDADNLPRTLARRSTAQRMLGRYQASIEDGQAALKLTVGYKELISIEAEATRSIGIALMHLGEIDQAIDWLQKSLQRYETDRDHNNVAQVRMELGSCYGKMGKYQKALSQYDQALEFLREANNTFRQSYVMNNLGVLYHLTGEYEQAAQVFKEAISHARQNNQVRIEAYLLCSLGDLYRDIDAQPAALEAYHQSCQLAITIDDSFLLFYLTLADAAQAYIAGKLTLAQEILTKIQRAGQVEKSGYEQDLWHFEAGRVSLAAGEINAAVNFLRKAVEHFIAGGQQVEAVRANLLLAQALQAVPDLPNALVELEHTFNLAAKLEGQHILVVTGREARPILDTTSAQEKSGVGQIALDLLKQINAFEASIPSLRRELRSEVATILYIPPKLTIQALGKTQVALNGEIVTSPEWTNQRRVRELFFYLLTHPRGLPKEEIGLLFWPESSSAQIKMNFKNAIYRLRLAVGSDVILFDGQRYRFNHQLDYEYDVSQFEEKLTKAHSFQEKEAVAAALKEAVALYQGDYFPEGEGSWVDEERQELRQKFFAATLELALLNLEAGDYPSTLHYCQKILTEDRCIEDAHRLAMQAYAALGDRAALIRQFEACSQAFSEEFDSSPSSQTVLLYQKLQH